MVRWGGHIVWTTFRLMSRHLAHQPDEIPRDLTAHGADGHGWCICCLFRLQRLGLLGMERRGVGFVLLPLGMLSGLIQHFQSAIFDAWQL